MAKKYSGGIPIATGFKLLDGQPIVDYMVVELIADLTNGTILPNQFEGMFTYVMEDQEMYVKKATGWVKIATGNDSITVDPFPTQGSNNPVSSGGVYSVLEDKADLLSGLVPESQLPSYVDDILEFPTLGDFPTTGETGKIYVAIDTSLQYRWGGTVYVSTNSQLALGETSATAYRGDRGKIAYDHSQMIGTASNPHQTAHNSLLNINDGDYKHLTGSQLTRVLDLIYVNSTTSITVSPTSGERGLSTDINVIYNIISNDDIFVSASINNGVGDVMDDINDGAQTVNVDDYVNNVTFTLSMQYNRNAVLTTENKSATYTTYIPQFAGASSDTDYTNYVDMSTDLQKYVQASASITKSVTPNNQYIWFISNKLNATVLDANNFTQTVGTWGDNTKEFWTKSLNLTLVDGVTTATVYLYRSRQTKTISSSFTYKIQ